MSFVERDPGDLTLDEMYGHQADGAATAVWKAPCPECRNFDGSINPEIMEIEGACTFGCGRTVDRDTRMCEKCGDHSANEWECPRCGTQYNDWSGQWEKAS